MPSRPDSRKDDIRQAIDSGSLSQLHTLLNNPSNDRKRDDLLAYALALSCDIGNSGVVRYLLVKEGADANRSYRLPNDKEDAPPLVLAVRCRSDTTSTPETDGSDSKAFSGQSWRQEDLSSRIEIIRSLFEHHALLQSLTSDKKTALSYISRREIAEVVLTISTESGFRHALELRDEIGRNALMCILEAQSHSFVADFYIDNGAEVRAVDRKERSILMYAVWKNHIDLVQRLIQNKDLVRLRDCRKWNVWHHIAMDTEQLEATAMLNALSTIHEDDAGVDEVDDKDRTSLHLSATHGTVMVAKAILKRKTGSVNVGEHRGKTPLHLAAAYGHMEMVKLLLEHGAEVDQECNGGLTPLHLACGCVTDANDIVNHLLAHGANVNSQDEEKRTPLHIAAAYGRLAVVRALLAAPNKPDINAECEGGWTPLHLASWDRHAHHLDPPTDTREDLRTDPPKFNYVEVVHALLRAGANVNCKSRASKTALHLAAESGHEDIVRLLLDQKDIILALKDDQGNTPLLNAAKSDLGKHVVPLLAPWTKQSIDSLPSIAKRVAQEFDANVFDFNKNDNRPHRYQVPIYNLLYEPYIKAGTVTGTNVSTRPDQSHSENFRWIHLPANNLSWVHTLLTKHFIEGDCSDVEEFKELERSLSQLQYRGQKVHARHMRPACFRLSKHPNDQNTSQSRPARLPLNGDSRFQTPLRVDSIDLLTDESSRPPSPGFLRSSTDLYKDRLHHKPISEVKINKPTREPKRTLQRHSSPSGAASRPKSTRKAKSTKSPIHTEAPSGHDTSDTSEAKICLFMPYLDLERKAHVDDMHRHIYPGIAEAGRLQVETICRDKQLYNAHLASECNEYCLHIRRTLDQYRYKNVNTRARDDDQVIWRYQDRLLKENQATNMKSGRRKHDVLMVDQLWIWVFGPQLIVTCFPQEWQHPPKKTPALLSSILENLNPRSGKPVYNVHELAVRIVGQCLAACDRSAERHGKLNYLDMFNSSVGSAMDKEVDTFKKFKIESDRAAQSLNLLHGHIPEIDIKPMSNVRNSSQAIVTDDTEEDEHFLNIREETFLLLEVKDIRDELGILSQVLDDQTTALQAMYDMVVPNASIGDQQRVQSPADDNLLTLQQQKAEVDSMTSQVQSIYESIVDSLEHKQRHASAIQARYAAIEARYTRHLANSTAEQAASSAKAGRILMIFTTVTVIFLPLSFLAAFFALNLEELPHNDQQDQQLSLSFVLKYIVGVGLGTASAFVLIAWYWHPFFRWIGEVLHPVKSMAKSGIESNGRSVTQQSDSNSIVPPSTYASAIPVRERRVQIDLEKGPHGSSSACSIPG
jgi:ankyrin repeat protein